MKLLHRASVFGAALFALALLGLPEGRSSAMAATETEASSCGEAGDVVAVSESADLHKGPGNETARILNPKATRMLGRDHYHQIDPSTTVRRLCERNGWTEVQIVTPDWLSHVSGWAPSDALRTIETAGDGERVYVDDDIYWDETTLPYKEQIVAQVNRIAKEPDCEEIEPYSVALSPSKGSSDDPVFFVTCERRGTYFNIWFRPDGDELIR